MRKILIIILIILLLVVCYFVSFQGLQILGFNVLSVFEIRDKNSDLETKLQEVSTLTSVTQPKAVADLNDSAKQLMIAKEEYNDKILYSTTEDIITASQSRPYETEYLWTRLGNHAKKNGINLRYELKKASSGASGQYDIYFTVTGSYVSISEFIASLENDSSLNFKIEDFKLIPNNSDTENLQSTFTVREVTIKVTDNSNSTTTNSTDNATDDVNQTTVTPTYDTSEVAPTSNIEDINANVEQQ